jgi:hypothetical protein
MHDTCALVIRQITNQRIINERSPEHTCTNAVRSPPDYDIQLHSLIHSLEKCPITAHSFLNYRLTKAVLLIVILLRHFLKLGKS